MVKATIVSIIDFCTKNALLTVVVALFLAGLSEFYAAHHFAINTDVTTLISSDLPWRQNEIKYEESFPNRYKYILAVVDAPSPEMAALASSALTERLASDPNLFPSVVELGGSAFFAQNGLLFRPTEEVGRLTQGLAHSAPLLRVPVVDPTLRGLGQMIAYVLAGVREHELTFDQAARPFTMASASLEDVLEGRPAIFSWRELVSGPPGPSELRRFLEIRPMLDYTALEPGAQASQAIRTAVADLDLAGRYQARVRLTGPVPVENEEFATIRDGAVTNGTITLAVVLLILWLALHSFRIILAVVIALFIGLSITATVGLLMVGALNLISVAFAVLFVGLGVDFGIQFSVRYRQERYKNPDLRAALCQAGGRSGFR